MAKAAEKSDDKEVKKRDKRNNRLVLTVGVAVFLWLLSVLTFFSIIEREQRF